MENSERAAVIVEVKQSVDAHAPDTHSKILVFLENNLVDDTTRVLSLCFHNKIMSHSWFILSSEVGCFKPETILLLLLALSVE